MCFTFKVTKNNPIAIKPWIMNTISQLISFPVSKY